MKNKLILAIAIGSLSTSNEYVAIKTINKNNVSVVEIAKENEILCSDLYQSRLDGIINNAVCYKDNYEVLSAWANEYDKTFKSIYEIVTNNVLDVELKQNDYATKIYMSFMQLSLKDFINNENSRTLLDEIGIDSVKEIQSVLNILLPAHLTNQISESILKGELNMVAI